MSTYLYRNNQQTGPFADADIRQRLHDGSLSYDALGWNAQVIEWTPLYILFPAAPPPPSALVDDTAPIASDPADLLCRVCYQGALAKKKKYRMSTPVVIIGYILLTPSVLCMLASFILFLRFGTTVGSASAAVQQDVRREMLAAGVPVDVMETALSLRTIRLEALSALTEAQQSIVRNAQTRLSMSANLNVASNETLLTGGLLLAAFVFAFVGGLAGWLLIMEKQVLECDHCGAVIAAS